MTDRSEVTLPAAGLAYTCRDCARSYPVDPSDPMDAQGKYIDHFTDCNVDFDLDDDTDPIDQLDELLANCTCQYIEDPNCPSQGLHHGVD